MPLLATHELLSTSVPAIVGTLLNKTITFTAICCVQSQSQKHGKGQMITNLDFVLLLLSFSFLFCDTDSEM